MIEEGTTFSPSALLSGCCLLSPPSSGVPKLSENTPKSSKRLQATEKFLSGEAWVPFKLLSRKKALIVEESQKSDVKMSKREENHWKKIKNFICLKRNVTWKTIVSNIIRDFRILTSEQRRGLSGNGTITPRWLGESRSNL